MNRYDKVSISQQKVTWRRVTGGWGNFQISLEKMGAALPRQLGLAHGPSMSSYWQYWCMFFVLHDGNSMVFRL